MATANTIEQGRLARINEGRNMSNLAESAIGSSNTLSFLKKLSNFWTELSKHWILLAVAIFLDFTFAFIPIIGPIFNFGFGAVLYLKFGGKGFFKTGATVVGGSIVDFVVGVLPINTAALVMRIIFK